MKCNDIILLIYTLRTSAKKFLIELMIIQPTKIKEISFDQSLTSHSTPKILIKKPIPTVTGSGLPILLNMILKRAENIL